MPEVIFPGPAGRIEARYTPGPEETSPIALILHPHPKAGGSMQDRLAVRMFQLFVARGFAALRFNFRGVGRSQGTFDNGMGELSDAASALDWVQGINPNAKQTWVVGYSFGAWIALQLLMRRPEIDGFIAIAPPANHYDFTFLAPCPSSGLILYGANDSVSPPGDTERMASKIRVQKNIVVDYTQIEGADHFFRTHLEEIATLSDEYLEMRKHLAPIPKITSSRGRA